MGTPQRASSSSSRKSPYPRRLSAELRTPPANSPSTDSTPSNRTYSRPATPARRSKRKGEFTPYTEDDSPSAPSPSPADERHSTSRNSEIRIVLGRKARRKKVHRLLTVTKRRTHIAGEACEETEHLSDELGGALRQAREGEAILCRGGLFRSRRNVIATGITIQ